MGRFPPVEERKIQFGHPVPLSHVWVWLDQIITDPSLVWLTGPSRLLGAPTVLPSGLEDDA